ncbi:hypothetical protein V7124_04200 [Neobacillus niacini]|uniref:hypothetical protein n=1 Tax=Neobacillus niacini TaxID=86668 RepID=UPI002FFDB2EB
MKYIKHLLHEDQVLFVITTWVEAKKDKNWYGRHKDTNKVYGTDSDPLILMYKRSMLNNQWAF